MKAAKTFGFWIILLIGFYFLAQIMTAGLTPEVYYPTWNELQEQIVAGNVQEVMVTDEYVRGVLKEYDGNKEVLFETHVPSLDIFYGLLNTYSPTTIQTYPPPTEAPWWYSILPTLFFVLIIGGVWFFFMQQNQGANSRMMNFGKSKAKMYGNNLKKVTFKDVAGVNEEQEELEEIVEFLKNPKKFADLGARIPKGVLLMGPPGTGKTLLARAVAGEAGVPFFSISGSDFVEMFVGVGASRVRDLFNDAKKSAPCIIFVDEIDAVGRQRGAGLGGGHDEREQTLNQLLVEMDGFDSNVGIIMIAATNRPDILDPALLRPGRFDRQIVVDVPDVKGREEILKVHSTNKPLAKSVDLQVLAKATPGFTGADLENLFNEGALLAARQNKKHVEMVDLEEAITRVMIGPEKKSRIIQEEERRLTAYHEAGHAIVAHMLPQMDPVHQVSIIPRGRAGGYTLVLPKEDVSYRTKTALLARITMTMGGRSAEEIFLGEISTGAVGDIDQATQLAKDMVMRYGMSDLGPIAFGGKEAEVFLGRDIAHTKNFSEEVVKKIDYAVIDFIEKSHMEARRILEEQSAYVHKLAEVLLQRESIDGEEFVSIMEDRHDDYLREEAVKKGEEAAAKVGASQDTIPAEATHDTQTTATEKASPEKVSEEEASTEEV